jgi:hypothetical protein
VPPQTVTGSFVQRAVQLAASPRSTSFVQADPSSGQEPGQAPEPAPIPLSQASPISRTPLPQTAGQSSSTFRLPPVGQQPSPGMKATIGLNGQAAVQPEPDSVSSVHGCMSSHAVGQAPVAGGAMPVSHVSPFSTTPLPQTTGQSVSVL